MNRALIERCHLICGHCVGDDSSAIRGSVVIEDPVLGEHLSDQAARGDDLELSAARMNVRCVEAARAQESDCHSTAGSDECWEGLAVRGDEISTLATLAFECWVAEVEDELAVFWQECKAVGCCVGKKELLCEGEG